MKIIQKIILLFILNIVLFTYFNISYAVQNDENSSEEIDTKIQVNIEEDNESTRIAKTDWRNVFGLGDRFINQGRIEKDNVEKNELTIDEEQIHIKTSNMFNILLTIGIALTVIIGGILGIKFISASAEDKAKIKESFIPYVVGCVVIYGAFGIWALVVNVLNQV